MQWWPVSIPAVTFPHRVVSKEHWVPKEGCVPKEGWVPKVDPPEKPPLFIFMLHIFKDTFPAPNKDFICVFFYFLGLHHFTSGQTVEDGSAKREKAEMS